MTEEKLYAKCDQCGAFVPAQALMVIKEPDSAPYKWQCQACDVVGFVYAEDILTQQMLDAKQKGEEPEPEVLIQVGGEFFLRIAGAFCNVRHLRELKINEKIIEFYFTGNVNALISKDGTEYAAIRKLFGG